MTEKQSIAARELAAGYPAAEAARRAGVSASTVHRWEGRADFAREVDRLRRPTPRRALEDALLATRPDGSPDYATRVQAAKALESIGPDPDGPGRDPAGATVRVRRELLEDPEAWEAGGR